MQIVFFYSNHISEIRQCHCYEMMQLFTEIKVVVVEQKLGQIEEFWNEFFDIGHVVLSGRQPCILDAVKHAIS